MSFGNGLFPLRRRQFFCAASTSLRPEQALEDANKQRQGLDRDAEIGFQPLDLPR
jgi:hypothetical protein